MQRYFAVGAVRDDALGAFLDLHLGVPHRDEVGALIGQISLLRNSREESMTPEEWARAVSAAVADVSQERR